MKSYLLSLLKHILFWFLFFALGRLLFLLSNTASLSGIGFLPIANSFFHALKLDLSMICYIISIPFIILTFQLIVQKIWLNRILKSYTFAMILICGIITFADISIYSEWSNKINYKALVYLKNPSEVFESATNSQLIFSVIGITVFTILEYWMYKKLILYPYVRKVKHFVIPALVLLILGLGLIFIGMRGGISETPISQSDSYFSKHQILNDAAVNPDWNLLHSCLNFSQLNKSNPFIFMEEKKARKIVNSLYEATSKDFIKVVKNENINVVIILLESWSADLVESLGGKQGITPYFKQLEKEGLLFTNMYSNGHRSQQGISVLLSGFPPVPITSITDNFEKYGKLNSMIRDVNQKGYKSTFYFAGDLNYGNLKAYLTSMQFDEIIDKDKFPISTPRGKLSIFDKELFNRHHDDMNDEHQPFFSIAFTASTHSPYDEPKIVEQLKWDVMELPYLNSAKYTDFCLGKYFENVKKEPWYDNTLFILVADHSHVTYNNWNYFSKEYQHIPMLWLGGALKDSLRGQQYDKLCSHLDLSKTILNQLNISSDKYTWSNDIFNPKTQEFAMIELTQGIAWIRKNNYLSYNGFQKKIIREDGARDSLYNAEEQAKAYLQILYDTYLKY